MTSPTTADPHPGAGAPLTADGAAVHVDLDLVGMTCAACANRIERKLNKLAGVRASVNYATEKAAVEFTAPLTLDDLIAAVAPPDTPRTYQNRPLYRTLRTRPPPLLRPPELQIRYGTG
jgi:copper chaperone CopZ